MKIFHFFISPFIIFLHHTLSFRVYPCHCAQESILASSGDHMKCSRWNLGKCATTMDPYFKNNFSVLLDFILSLPFFVTVSCTVTYIFIFHWYAYPILLIYSNIFYPSDFFQCQCLNSKPRLYSLAMLIFLFLLIVYHMQYFIC